MPWAISWADEVACALCALCRSITIEATWWIKISSRAQPALELFLITRAPCLLTANGSATTNVASGAKTASS